MDLMAFVPYSMTAPTVQHEPNVEHVCEELPKEDPLMRMIPGYSPWARIRRWFLGTRITSQLHPFTRWCLKSTQAIDYEISHHLKSHPYMIHPFSSFRIFWESVITLFIIAVLLITPVFLTFYFDECAKWYMYNHAIDIILMCDIIIKFFTGHYDSRTKLVILDPRIVARKYLRGFFIVDTLSILPLEFIIVLTDSMWYLTSLNLLKILRIRTVIVYSRKLYYVYRINFHLFKIAEIGVFIVVGVHWAACMEYYLPLMVDKIAGQQDLSWIRSPYMEKREMKYQIYLACINRAIIALIGAAQYLDVSAPEDIIYNLILSIFGFLGFVYLLARMMQLMSTFHSINKRHLKLIQQLQQYMKHKELSHSLQRRLLIYYNYRNKKGFERDKIIINHVSPYLREKLLLHNYIRLLNNVRLFGHLPQIVIRKLIGAVYSEIFMPNDALVKAGTRGDALYFISSGTVAVYNNIGKEIYHMEDGAYFGELALVIEDEHWIASVIAIENCEIYILSRSDFQYALAPYRDLLAHLQNVALARLEQMPLLKKAHDASPLFRNINSIKAKKRDDIIPD
ncbi:potassium/sodium hyperpolarization-activated cyclic nucleotide-gated channel 1-like isoform X3 [Cataglyphis hispanica]|uniref:potassium/sodium hyperpolarization-activated cyclic nucleotide-gated channel 1-like isoform X3 n=1 Tax=Cataglyphis hispanica TaxID=1086592 RepID=UPI00217FA787|nr:potassium/sodium hyperpolarization-activated cyclic nucleotide-gated channel 1-like isoform X3 [Cataglyphis hispanica]